jgi:hypothetical protein
VAEKVECISCRKPCYDHVTGKCADCRTFICASCGKKSQRMGSARAVECGRCEGIRRRKAAKLA